MPYAAGVALACMAVAIAILMALQINSFVRGRCIITRRHFALRLAAGGCLLAIIIASFVGAAVRFSSPVWQLAYWGAVMVLAGVGVALALADLRLTQQAIHLRRAEFYRKLAELQTELEKAAEQRRRRDGNGEVEGGRGE